MLFVGSAHGRTEPGGSDSQGGWCSGFCAQADTLFLSGRSLSPLQRSQVALRWVLDHRSLHTKTRRRNKMGVRVQTEMESPWKGLRWNVEEGTRCPEDTVLTHRSDAALRAGPL